MKNGFIALFIQVGLAVSLGEAMLYTVYVSWWTLPVAAVLFLAAVAFVGCIDLRPGWNDMVGWAVLLALSVISGYIGLQSLGIAGWAGGLHLALWVVYAIAGIIGMNMGLKREAA